MGRNVTSKKKMRLYNDLSWLWSAVSSADEYAKDSEIFVSTLKEYSKIEVKTVLHLGCGMGYIDHVLKKYFEVTGVDISEAMLKGARKFNPEVEYVRSDMRTVRLGRSFDAVIIPDLIDYMTTAEDLKNVLSIAFKHLSPGGVFIAIVEKTAEKFIQNETTHTTHKSGDTEAVFVENKYDPDTTDTSYETTMVYIVRRKGKLDVYTDLHPCGIFPEKTWMRLLEEAGFEAKRIDFKPPSMPQYCFPMFVCTKSL